MEGQSEDCPFLRNKSTCTNKIPAAMEGQSEDCPFLEAASIHAVSQQYAAMEGQSEDCPFRLDWSGLVLTGLAAMEGQSEDCPFHATGHTTPTACVRRNGGAVGRLPVSPIVPLIAAP